MLRGMTHYWYWGMDAEAADARSALEEIDRAIRLDSAFTNQNKHLYRLSAGTGLVLGDLPLEKDYALGSDIPARNPVAKPPMDSSAGMSEPGAAGADTSAYGPIGGSATGPGAEVSAPSAGFRAGIQPSMHSTALCARGGPIGRRDSRSVSTRGSRESPFRI